jgi:sugar lactone lactonase YvrE
LSSTSLYTVNPSNAEATFIGNMGNGFGGGLAFNPAGDLYITRAYGTEQLYSVNPTTAAITLIGNTGTPDSFAMAFDNDTLYMTDMNGGIWTVNTATGASTQISSYDKSMYGSILGLASPNLLSVSEPSTLALAGLGGLALLARRRRP